jgi:hypothetical protein
LPVWWESGFAPRGAEGSTRFGAGRDLEAVAEVDERVADDDRTAVLDPQDAVVARRPVIFGHETPPSRPRADPLAKPQL